MISIRVTAVAVVVALAALVPAVDAFERVGDKKILVFAGRQEVPTIDPSIKYDWSIRMMQQALYDGLVKYVGNPPEIQPWLAERWEVSPDAKTWTFHLAKNARFHTGDPVTAEAVRWSFARTLKLNQGPAWMLSDFLKEDGVRVVDDHTIRFTLTSPYAPFLSFVPWWYVMNPKQVRANQQGDDLGQKWLTTNAAGGHGSHFYENPDVWGLIERARSISRWEERAPLYAEIQKRVAADAPEIFGMLANRRWGMRDWVKGFVFSPVRFTGEVDLYPLAVVAK